MTDRLEFNLRNHVLFEQTAHYKTEYTSYIYEIYKCIYFHISHIY